MARQGRVETLNTAGRNMFGGAEMDKAERHIWTLCHETVNQYVDFNYTIAQVIPWVFPDGVIADLRKIHGYTQPSSPTANYRLSPHWENITMVMGFGNQTFPTPTQTAFVIDKTRAMPLIRAIDTIREIHFQFAEVLAVLRYFNAYATAGATRYYWPPALGLCPESISAELPARFNEPDNIQAWLPAVRSSANTWAKAALLPTAEPVRLRHDLKLVIERNAVQHGSCAAYQTDQRVYLLA